VQARGGALFLTELIIQESTRHVQMTVKSENKRNLSQFIDFFFVVVSSFITHAVE
jgi:hypothetical protein